MTPNLLLDRNFFSKPCILKGAFSMQLACFSVWPQAASSMDSNAPVVGAGRETTVPKHPRTKIPEQCDNGEYREPNGGFVHQAAPRTPNDPAHLPGPLGELRISKSERAGRVRCSVWLGEVLVCVSVCPRIHRPRSVETWRRLASRCRSCRRTRTGRQCCRPSIPSGMNSRTVLDRAVGRPTTSCRRPC